MRPFRVKFVSTTKAEEFMQSIKDADLECWYHDPQKPQYIDVQIPEYTEESNAIKTTLARVGDWTPSGPLCPGCGDFMKFRRAIHGKHQGEHFWGCIKFPRCRNIVSFEESDLFPLEVFNGGKVMPKSVEFEESEVLPTAFIENERPTLLETYERCGVQTGRVSTSEPNISNPPRSDTPMKDFYRGLAKAPSFGGERPDKPKPVTGAQFKALVAAADETLRYLAGDINARLQSDHTPKDVHLRFNAVFQKLKTALLDIDPKKGGR